MTRENTQAEKQVLLRWEAVGQELSTKVAGEVQGGPRRCGQQVLHLEVCSDDGLHGVPAVRTHSSFCLDKVSFPLFS